MPTYTYECKKCGSAQDEFHSMSVTPVVECGSCGSKRMRKLLGTGAGIIFKGSGFYETDYKRNGTNGQGSSSQNEGAKSDSKSESKSESKGGSNSAGSSGESGKGSGSSASKAKPAAAN